MIEVTKSSSKRHILGYLSDSLQDVDPMNDVTLQCGDGCVPCHQLVLASLSPMLSSILSSDTLKQSYHIVSHQILTG